MEERKSLSYSAQQGILTSIVIMSLMTIRYLMANDTAFYEGFYRLALLLMAIRIGYLVYKEIRKG